jgi:hypothetical protein
MIFLLQQTKKKKLQVQRCRGADRWFAEKREFGWLALLAGWLYWLIQGPRTPPSMRIACGGWC